ncbi:MAG: carboxypeptidase regulatory-like domain-containing protein, partial [Nitrospirae bacterium]|nr:carboxypeptidase regulatory-like domain-containing protein [Nitrospirota bacterium]
TDAEAPKIIGEVLAVGKVEMALRGQPWMGLETRSYPIVADARLRTADGRAAVLLTRIGRLELGRQTESLVSAGPDGAALLLSRGSVKYSISPHARVYVQTPAVLVEIGRGVEASAGTVRRAYFSGDQAGSFHQGTITVGSDGRARVVTTKGVALAREVSPSAERAGEGQARVLSAGEEWSGAAAGSGIRKAQLAQLVEGAVISGEIRKRHPEEFKKGEPVKDATVNIQLGADTWTVRTDDQGRWMFTTLRPGVHSVTPSDPCYAFEKEKESVTVRQANIPGVNFIANDLCLPVVWWQTPAGQLSIVGAVGITAALIIENQRHRGEVTQTIPH